MAHKGHPKCEFTSKAKCDQAAKEALGRCSSLTEKETECSHWAVDRVNDRAYCGQHISGIIQREYEARVAAQHKAARDLSIDSYLRETGQVAHECGVVCYFSNSIQGPRLSDLTAGSPAGLA